MPQSENFFTIIIYNVIFCVDVPAHFTVSALKCPIVHHMFSKTARKFSKRKPITQKGKPVTVKILRTEPHCHCNYHQYRPDAHKCEEHRENEFPPLFQLDTGKADHGIITQAYEYGSENMKNRIIKICGRLNFFFSPSLGPLLINNLLSDLSAILFTYHNLCSSLSLFTVFCIIFSTDSDISDRGKLKLLTVMPGVKLFYIFIYVTTAKKIFGYILTLISCMTKSPENPDSVKNHKHSSSVFPHHCRMVLEYLM